MTKFATDLNIFYIKVCVNRIYFMYMCACVCVYKIFWQVNILSFRFGFKY